jgi:hypothetical protein
VGAGYVLDHTALVALGAGNLMLSQLVQAAHESADDNLFVPAVCLLAAVADRPALADHVGALPGLDVVELDYPAAAAAGRLVADGVDWRMAHAIHVALPSAEWPRGRPVVTGIPAPYEDRGVPTLPLR